MGLKNLVLLSLLFSASLAQAQLSKYEKDIIQDYTSTGYFVSNGLENQIDYGVPGLIGRIQSASPDSVEKNNIKYSAHLNSALDKLPTYGTAGDAKVYRGIYSANVEKYKALFAKGRTWIERRYTSSTSDKKVAMEFALGAYKNEGCGGCDSSTVQKPDPKNGYFLTITSRTGKDISSLAADPNEKEILFKSGVIFKVMDVQRAKNGVKLITIEELDAQNLSAADKMALQKNELERLERLKASSLYNYRPFADIVADWNQAYQEWQKDGSLQEPLNLEILNENGG